MIVSFCESGLKHACSAVQFRGYAVNFRATSCLTKPRIQLVSVTIHMWFHMFHLVICILLSFFIPWTWRYNKTYSVPNSVCNRALQCFRFPLFSSWEYDTKGRVAMVTWCTSEVLTATCIRQQNGHSLVLLSYVVDFRTWFSLWSLLHFNRGADFLLQMVICICMCDGG